MSDFRRLFSGTKVSLSTELLLGAISPHGLVFQSHLYTSVSVIRLQISYSHQMGLFMFQCPPMFSCRRCSEIDYPITTSHHYLTLNCNIGEEITGAFTRAYFLCGNTFAGRSMPYFVAHFASHLGRYASSLYHLECFKSCPENSLFPAEA